MKKRILPILTAVLAVVLIAATCRVTVVPDEIKETLVNAAGETVEVVKLSVTDQYTLDNWETSIIPAIHERAVDVPVFLSAVTGDLNTAGAAHGNRANETSAWSFCVKGEGKVLEIENPDKPNKTNLVLDIEPYDGQADIKLHYGKVFSSNIKNAIRDGVGFLKLDDFTNQVEFADLTTSFNNKVKNEIILSAAADTYAGKTVSFYGCISLQDTKPESLVIIPVELAVVGN
jgi:predicted lipoprotein